MEQKITIQYIGGAILNLLIFALLITIYTYILKLENIGCECSAHPTKEFIKSYTIISIVFLALTAVVSMKDIHNYFGEAITIIFSFITLIFYIIFVVYIYMTFEYVRYLINEKCKCSEELRREIIMVGTMIETILFFVAILVLIIVPVLIEVVSSIFNKLPDLEDDIKETINNPLTSMKKVPGKLQKSASSISKFAKKSSSDLKKLSKRK